MTPILDIDSKGLINVLEKKTLNNPIVIYLHLKSGKVVEDRLVARGKDSEESIKKRVARYEWDVKLVKDSPLVDDSCLLLNDTLE